MAGICETCSHSKECLRVCCSCGDKHWRTPVMVEDFDSLSHSCLDSLHSPAKGEEVLCTELSLFPAHK